MSLDIHWQDTSHVAKCRWVLWDLPNLHGSISPLKARWLVGVFLPLAALHNIPLDTRRQFKHDLCSFDCFIIIIFNIVFSQLRILTHNKSYSHLISQSLLLASDNQRMPLSLQAVRYLAECRANREKMKGRLGMMLSLQNIIQKQVPVNTTTLSHTHVHVYSDMLTVHFLYINLYLGFVVLARHCLPVCIFSRLDDILLFVMSGRM